MQLQNCSPFRLNTGYISFCGKKPQKRTITESRNPKTVDIDLISTIDMVKKSIMKIKKLLLLSENNQKALQMLLI